MLNSPLLPRIAGFIGGAWKDASAAKTFAVRNPATGEHLADVPDMGEVEARDAVDAAAASMRQASSLAERRAWLSAIAQSLTTERAELARIITLEQGKPLKESADEVDYAAGFFRFFAGRIEHLEPRTLPERIRNCRWTVHHRPAGVAALITPWNFPLAMLAKKLSGAIAGGCSVVARPASLTPLTTVALWTLIARLEGLASRLNLVTGGSGPIGRVFCTHPAVRVVSFTGSTEVGRTLIRQTADGVKRVTMELGGNAPFIVFDDARLEAAADALITNKFRAAGQTCVCANRIYVHQRVADSFTAMVAERMGRLKVGNGLEAGTDVGPLINRDAFDKVSRHVADAIAGGARRLVGGDPVRPQKDWGCFYPPTVLTGVRPGMLVCEEETFGPVVAVGTFDTQEQVVRLANGTPFGLAAYLFRQDAARAGAMAAQLQFGHLGINTGAGPTPEAPFGGMKQSGFGREGGIEGLFEFTETQAVASG